MFELLFWLVYKLVEVFATMVIYRQISKAKLNVYFASLCLGIIIVIPFLASLMSSQLLMDVIVLLQPLGFYLYLNRVESLSRRSAFFLALFLHLSMETPATFLSVIISSLIGDGTVVSYWGAFYIFVNIISFLFIIRAVRYFDFQLDYFKEEIFREQLMRISALYIVIHLLLNCSHWLSGLQHLNSFSSMMATICFLMFISTLFYLQSVREKQEKEEQIKQKEREQLQLQRYTDEIVNLYNEIRGFRHDYASMLTSMQTAFNTGDIKEVERIYQAVLLDANLSLRSETYSYFDLNNVGDSALKSVMTETMFKAREHGIELTFEVKDPIEKLPIKLLDMVRIASILLNNAIEASVETYEKYVNVSLVQLDTEVIFVVKNSRKDRELDLEEIYQADFSTKGTNRGLGLSNIKEILNRYDFITLDTEMNQHDFTQILTIKKRNPL